MIMETLEKYIGKTIESFKFSSGELNFGFTDGDKLSLRAEGDCCSNSWFEEIFGDEALVKGAGLLELRLIELPETEEGDYELTRFYGVKFKTTLGHAEVDMRNTSNGYYGGFIRINGIDSLLDETWHSEWN
jgi:hypothetical protein